MILLFPQAATSNRTDAQTEYHVVPREHWQTPSWIDQHRYMDALDYLGTIGVGKGHMLSYHSMIRYVLSGSLSQASMTAFPMFDRRSRIQSS